MTVKSESELAADFDRLEAQGRKLKESYDRSQAGWHADLKLWERDRALRAKLDAECDRLRAEVDRLEARARELAADRDRAFDGWRADVDALELARQRADELAREVDRLRAVPAPVEVLAAGAEVSLLAGRVGAITPGVPAVVAAACLRGSELTYEVVRWERGERRVEWVHARELVTGPGVPTARIGFRVDPAVSGA